LKTKMLGLGLGVRVRG